MNIFRKARFNWLLKELYCERCCNRLSTIIDYQNNDLYISCMSCLKTRKLGVKKWKNIK